MILLMLVGKDGLAINYLFGKSHSKSPGVETSDRASKILEENRERI